MNLVYGLLILGLWFVPISQIQAQGVQAPECDEGLEFFAQTLHKKLRKDCAYCHGGQGPGHSVADVKTSYKMVKNLLRLSNSPQLESLKDSPFISIGGNNHCAGYGVECATTSDELLSLVRPWIQEEIKSCTGKNSPPIVTETVPLPQNGALSLSVLGYEGVKVQGTFEAHPANAQGTGYVKIKNLKVCHPSARVMVKGLKILVDGQEDNYAQINQQNFDPCGQNLHSSTLLYSASKREISPLSRLQISLESIKIEPVNSTCKFQKEYDKAIRPNIQSSCIKCHTSKNLSPLSCEDLVGAYKSVDAQEWRVYFESERYHPKVEVSQSTEFLRKFLELETSPEDSTYEYLLSGLKKLVNILEGYFVKNSSKSPTNSSYIDIVVGASHTCALNKLMGLAKCWGSNSYGQIGSSRGDRKKLKEVEYLNFENIKQLVSGTHHTCALFEDGRAKCWGANNYRQLGYDSSENFLYSNEVDYIPLNNIKELSAGSNYTCALFETGRARCWGDNINSQLGGKDNHSPKLLRESANISLKNIKKIFAGRDHTCALLLSGKVNCWGSDTDGQLGGYEKGGRVLFQDSQFIPLPPIKYISTGEYSTCAILLDGRAKCWGYNPNGMLGNGPGDGTNSMLLRDTGFLDLPHIESISVGSSYACAVMSQGAKCWGYNSDNQLGYSDDETRTRPEKYIHFFPLLDFFK